MNEVALVNIDKKLNGLESVKGQMLDALMTKILKCDMNQLTPITFINMVMGCYPAKQML